MRESCMSSTSFEVLKSRLVESLRMDSDDDAQALVQELAGLLDVTTPAEPSESEAQDAEEDSAS